MTTINLTKHSIENIRRQIVMLEVVNKMSPLHKEQKVALKTAIKVLKDITTEKEITFKNLSFK